jgi:UDP-GlcNAc3NAcA epimerase
MCCEFHIPRARVRVMRLGRPTCPAAEREMVDSRRRVTRKGSGMKIVTIVGARPQFVKAAAVRRAIDTYNQEVAPCREVLVHTGQHYDYSMNGVFFEELGLPAPDHHLGVGSASHGRQTALMIERIEAVLQQEKPEIVLVYGDTNSTVAGALSGAKMGIPVAHVEAGLRSYNRVMPEEINRVLTDHLSTILFCPTANSVRNLAKEGIRDAKEKAVKKVGDVMYDSVLHYTKRAETKSTILRDLGLLPATPRDSGIQGPGYYLATIHRAENTDDAARLGSIIKALSEIGRHTTVVLPLHPRTKKMMEAHHVVEGGGIRMIDPAPYFDMLLLEKNATAILTDSGGVQKEAYWFGVPCITLRHETEWVETVESGWNVLVGTEPERIVRAVRDAGSGAVSKRGKGLLGDGQASERIITILSDRF